MKIGRSVILSLYTFWYVLSEWLLRFEQGTILQQSGKLHRAKGCDEIQYKGYFTSGNMENTQMLKAGHKVVG